MKGCQGGKQPPRQILVRRSELMPWYYLLRNFPRIDLYCVYVNVWEKSWYYRKKKSRLGSFQDKMSDILLNENRH